MVDMEAARKIWNGKIPCVFNLSPVDRESLRQPDPIYDRGLNSARNQLMNGHPLSDVYWSCAVKMMVPRCSYFALVCDDSLWHRFQEFAAKGGDGGEIWLEHNNKPLKWHMPIGFQFDLYGDATQLPWEIYVHFRQFPADKVISLSGKDGLQTHFYQMIKQAEYLRSGSTKKIMNMKQNDQTQLWEGLKDFDFDRFWEVKKVLIRDEGNKLRNIPIRFYLDEDVVVQELVPPTTAGSAIGKETTLLDALQYCLPHMFPVPPGAAAALQRTGDNGAGAPGPTGTPSSMASEDDDASGAVGTPQAATEAELPGGPTTAPEEEAGAATGRLATAPNDLVMASPMSSLAAVGSTGSVPASRVIVQGVSPPLEAPLKWLSDNLSYPDGFLHVVIRQSSAE